MKNINKNLQDLESENNKNEYIKGYKQGYKEGFDDALNSLNKNLAYYDKCPVCKIDIRGLMGYYCSRNDCPKNVHFSTYDRFLEKENKND